MPKIPLYIISAIVIFLRAKIERENRDIKLEKIRVKAAEQRETVLQSIKWVAMKTQSCVTNTYIF